MKIIRPLARIVVCTLCLAAVGSSAAHATTQEAFVCTLKAGKTVEDLMKVAGEFKAAIADLPGGKDYRAQVLVPIASQNLDSVIWIGQMPSFSAMAVFNDAYNGSPAEKRLTVKFEALTDCESRSFWQVMSVE